MSISVVWSFKTRGIKSDRFLAKNEQVQKKSQYLLKSTKIWILQKVTSVKTNLSADLEKAEYKSVQLVFNGNLNHN